MGEDVVESIPMIAEPQSARKQDDDERLARHPVGRAVYDLVSRNDWSAFRVLQNRIRMRSWKVPPFDARDKESAISEHLWDRILKKTGNDPRPPVVLPLARDGSFDYLPHEVTLRLIDDARKGSAKKRGGDGDHIPVFDTLRFEGEREARIGDADSFEGEAQKPRPKGSRIEHQTREVLYRLTENVWRKELASDTRIQELGPASTLWMFYLENPDAEHWTDVEIARELGVTDRTIRSYRQKIIPFVKKYL
jgi:hypothetical protein